MAPSHTQTGWHRADIVAAVWKQGSNLSRLSLDHGFAASTLRASLGKRHPRAHQVIARFLGVPVAEIWPQFYAAGAPGPRGDTTPRRSSASSPKHEAV